MCRKIDLCHSNGQRHGHIVCFDMITVKDFRYDYINHCDFYWFSNQAEYKLTLTTHWEPSAFPRHFPQWRPTPQWSKTIGRGKIVDKYKRLTTCFKVLPMTHRGTFSPWVTLSRHNCNSSSSRQTQPVWTGEHIRSLHCKFFSHPSEMCF